MKFKIHAPARRAKRLCNQTLAFRLFPYLISFMLEKYIDVSTSKVAVHSRNDEKNICYQAQPPGRLSCLKGHAPDRK
jgi:hypothetical protein